MTNAGKTYIDHTDHGHPITGQAGKVARAKCRKLYPGGVGAEAEAMSWTQPICDACWNLMYPDRTPTRLVEGVRSLERCSHCNTVTHSGIYIRCNPATVPYPQEEAE